MKKYIFQSQFEITADNQEEAYQQLATELELMLRHADDYTPKLEYFGTEFVEEREI